MQRHQKGEKRSLGVAILAVLGIFLVLHLALPAATLWPYLLVALVVITMIVSHTRKDSYRNHRITAQPPGTDS